MSLRAQFRQDPTAFVCEGIVREPPRKIVQPSGERMANGAWSRTNARLLMKLLLPAYKGEEALQFSWSKQRRKGFPEAKWIGILNDPLPGEEATN